ncbi:MAG TPA: autotransporter-associated beta strand repeat-containing protein, partial [Luteolibacter sp.]
SQWSTDTTGVAAPAASITTLTSDVINFGNGATGLAAGTIAVSGTVDSGNMTFASGSGAIILSGGTINLAAASTITVNNTTNTIGSILTGAGTSLTKAGTGELVLTNSNSYTGTTIISGGKLTLSGGNNRLATTGTVNFSGTSTLDVGSTSQTLANLTVANAVTGTVTGATGTLTLNGAAFQLGSATAGSAQTLNLSGLGTFNYNRAVSSFTVAGTNNTAAGSSATMTLAATNTITASAFNVGNTSGSLNTSVDTGTVNLGATTTINADTVTIGSNRSAGTVKYASGNNVALTLRGTNGTDRVANMTVGAAGGPAIAGQVGTVDLTTNVTGTSTLDAMIGTLTIGSNTRASNAAGNTIITTGTFTMGGGTLDATTIILGQNLAGYVTTGTTSSTTGTMTVGGGTVKVGSLYLADQQVSLAVAAPITSTFNLNGGGNLYATTIAKGNGTGTSAVTRTFNWNNGTIHNYDASTDLTFGSGITVKLAAAGTHTFDIGTGRNASVASVLSDATTGGTLTKAGNGKLTLSGTNTYTGATTVTAGTLLVNGSTAAGSAVSVAAGSTLGGIGTINGAVNVTGVLAPGASVESLKTGSVTMNNLSTLAIELDSSASLTVGSDLLAASGLSLTNVTLSLDDIAVTDTAFANGTTFTLANYGGTAITSGFTGLVDDTTFTSGLNTWLIDYNALSGGSNFTSDQTAANFINITAVPEPGAALLGGLGLLALLRRRR